MVEGSSAIGRCCCDRAPVVDVGVVTWNTAELTVRALRRLLDTDQGVDLRVLVRDNGSTDGTPDRLADEVPEAEVDAGPDQTSASPPA